MNVTSTNNSVTNPMLNIPMGAVKANKNISECYS